MPTLSADSWDDPDLAALTAQQVELRARYGGASELRMPPSAADVAVVLLARDDDGTPIGSGALRPLGDGTAELKRMYVVPAARGRGVSRLLLTGLETGPRQPEAIGLYTAAGYRPVPAFGHYLDDPFSLCFARELA